MVTYFEAIEPWASTGVSGSTATASRTDNWVETDASVTYSASFSRSGNSSTSDVAGSRDVRQDFASTFETRNVTNNSFSNEDHTQIVDVWFGETVTYVSFSEVGEADGSRTTSTGVSSGRTFTGGGGTYSTVGTETFEFPISDEVAFTIVGTETGSSFSASIPTSSMTYNSSWTFTDTSSAQTTGSETYEEVRWATSTAEQTTTTTGDPSTTTQSVPTTTFESYEQTRMVLSTDTGSTTTMLSSSLTWVARLTGALGRLVPVVEIEATEMGMWAFPDSQTWSSGQAIRYRDGAGSATKVTLTRAGVEFAAHTYTATNAGFITLTHNSTSRRTFYVEEEAVGSDGQAETITETRYVRTNTTGIPNGLSSFTATRGIIGTKLSLFQFIQSTETVTYSRTYRAFSLNVGETTLPIGYQVPTTSTLFGESEGSWSSSTYQTWRSTRETYTRSDPIGGLPQQTISAETIAATWTSQNGQTFTQSRFFSIHTGAVQGSVNDFAGGVVVSQMNLSSPLFGVVGGGQEGFTSVGVGDSLYYPFWSSVSSGQFAPVVYPTTVSTVRFISSRWEAYTYSYEEGTLLATGNSTTFSNESTSSETYQVVMTVGEEVLAEGRVNKFFQPKGSFFGGLTPRTGHFYAASVANAALLLTALNATGGITTNESSLVPGQITFFTGNTDSLQIAWSSVPWVQAIATSSNTVSPAATFMGFRVQYLPPAPLLNTYTLL
jgi:hypothetical protein